MSVVDDKWVRVMCDFAANGLWVKSGAAADIDDIPLDNTTFFELGVWQHWYEARKHDEPIRSLDRFVKYGLRIARDIKEQWPDWTVIYHDEEKAEAGDPNYEYEVILPDDYQPRKTRYF